MSINVLCLHGCNQNPDAFSSYLSAVTKMAKKTQFSDPKINFFFIPAPFVHPLGGLTWTDPPLEVDDIWHNFGDENSRDNALTAEPKLSRKDQMLEKTFELVQEEIGKHDIRVLLGFSQGSFVIYEYMRKFRDQRIERIVTMSGYTFKETFDEGSIDENLPILNVVHPMDSIVPSSLKYTKSKNTFELTHNNKNIETPCREAHVVPTRAEHCRAICQFIQTGAF